MGGAVAPIGLATGLVGGVLNMFGASDQSQAQQMQLQAQATNAAYQAQVATNNAKIAGVNTNLDLQAGSAAETNRGMKTRTQVGTQLADQGASGVDVNTGSFVGSRAATSEIGALDALTIRSNTAKQAYADEVQQTNYQAEAGLETQEAGQATAAANEVAEAGPLSAAGSLLSGASSLGGSYYKYLQTS